MRLGKGLARGKRSMETKCEAAREGRDIPGIYNSMRDGGF